MSDLPVIDVSGLFDGADRQSIDREIGAALARAGGLVVTGFPGADRLEARAARLLQFFDLPRCAKVDAGTRPTNPDASHVYRGFTSLLGHDDFARTEWFDIGPSKSVAAPPVRGTDILTETNLWPNTEPYAGWRVDMEDHFADLQATALAIVLSAGRAAGIETDSLAGSFISPNSTLRLLHYPAPEMDLGPTDPVSLAAEAHTDGSGVSLLWQAGPGLQAQAPDGVWRDVPQLPGSISVHLGDVLEMITDGAISATPHRVIDYGGARSSIGFFLEPALTASMTGSESLQDTYAWRLLERLHGYPSMRELVPAPTAL